MKTYIVKYIIIVFMAGIFCTNQTAISKNNINPTQFRLSIMGWGFPDNPFQTYNLPFYGFLFPRFFPNQEMRFQIALYHKDGLKPNDNYPDMTPVMETLECFVIYGHEPIPIGEGIKLEDFPKYLRKHLESRAVKVEYSIVPFKISDAWASIELNIKYPVDLEPGKYKLVVWVSHSLLQPYLSTSDKIIGIIYSNMNFTIGPPRNEEEILYQHYLNAFYAMKDNNLSKALEEINSLLEIYPLSSTAHAFKGDIYLKMIEPQKSLICYQKAIELLTNDFDIKDSRIRRGGHGKEETLRHWHLRVEELKKELKK